MYDILFLRTVLYCIIIYSLLHHNFFENSNNHVISNHPNQCRLLLVRPTGHGKLLVIYGYGTLLCGVILAFIPIIALGSDQVQSIMSIVPKDSSVVAVHLDSLRSKEEQLHFLSFLLSMNKLNY